MKKLLILVLILMMVLAGCGKVTSVADTPTTQPANTTAPTTARQTETTTEAQTEQTNPDGLEVIESEIGVMTVYHLNRDFVEVKTSGPFTITFTGVRIADLVVAEDSKYLFDDQDRVTVVSVKMDVENTSKDTMTIYADQGTIVTNTKEQIDADLFISDDLGGDFMGEVIKSGDVHFMLYNSAAGDVTSFKYICGAPMDEDWDDVGEDIIFEYDINNY